MINKVHPVDLPQDVSLEGPRLLLKPITLEDAGNLRDLLSDLDTMQYLLPMAKYPQGWSLEDTQHRVITHLDLQNKNMKFNFHVFIKSKLLSNSDEPNQQLIFIGCAGYPTVELANHSSAVGIILNRKYWSAGYATECLYLLLKYAFETLFIHRIYFETSEFNKAMRGWLVNVALAKHESVMQDALFDDGKYTSLCVYTIFDRDWGSKTKTKLISKLCKYLSEDEIGLL